MEVLPFMPRSPDFHFTTTTTTAPTTPPTFPHHYTSAPTSPTRAPTALHSNLSFEFSFSADPPEISTADELFHKGKIRPLHLAPPIAAASSGQRGRIKNSVNRPRETRSLSPLRNQSFIKNSIFTKWKLKDFLLFRSASEGRASGRYTLLSSLSSFSLKSKKKGGEEEEEEECKCGSFRSSESGGGSVRRGGAPPPASAHEMHYTANRAAAGEKRKKTPLAYQRQGLFSCLQFNPAIRSIAKGFSSFS